MVNVCLKVKIIIVLILLLVVLEELLEEVLDELFGVFKDLKCAIGAAIVIIGVVAWAIGGAIGVEEFVLLIVL